MSSKSKIRIKEVCTLVLAIGVFCVSCAQTTTTGRVPSLGNAFNDGDPSNPTPPSVTTTTTTLAPPPTNPPPPAIPPTDADLSDRCQNGAQCWTFPGLIHKPVPGNDYKRVEVQPRAGNYTKLRMSAVVVNNGWRSGLESKSHALIWFARDGRHRDLMGYLFAQGPRTNKAVMRSGIGIEAGLKPKNSSRFNMEIGHHYRIVSLYDMGTGRALSVIFNQSGQEVLRVQQTPNVSYLNFTSHQKISVDFGFVEGVNPSEPATYNWEYKDLMIEATEVR